MLRGEADGQFTVVGRPAGLTHVGGVDFDDAVLASVMGHLDPATRAAFGLDGAAEIDAEGAAALAALRTACAAAKVTLSTSTSAVVPVAVAGKTTNIRLTRAEFETLVIDALRPTLVAFEDALDDADVAPADLSCVLLAGGSARIPLVTQMLSARLGSKVTIARDIDPKMAVAAGAALAVGRMELGALGTTWVLDAVPARTIPAQAASQVDGLAKARSRNQKQAVGVVQASVAKVGAIAAYVAPAPAAPAAREAARPVPAQAPARAVPAQAAASALPAALVRSRPIAPPLAGAGFVQPEGRAARRLAARAAEAAMAPAREEAVPVALATPAPAEAAPRPVVEPVLYFEDDFEDDDAYAAEPRARWYSVMRMPRGTVRRVLTVTSLTTAIFVGSGAWSAAIPATSEKPVAVKAVKHQGR